MPVTGEEIPVGDSVVAVGVARGTGDGDVDDESDKIELNDELRWMREGVLAPPPPNFMSRPLPPIAGDPGRDGDPLEVARPLELPGLVSLGRIQPFSLLSFATSSLLIWWMIIGGGAGCDGGSGRNGKCGAAHLRGYTACFRWVALRTKIRDI